MIEHRVLLLKHPQIHKHGGAKTAKNAALPSSAATSDLCFSSSSTHLPLAFHLLPVFGVKGGAVKHNGIKRGIDIRTTI